LQENSNNNYQQSGITETVNAYSSGFKLSGSCKPCGDTSGACGICHINVEANSAFCSYHGIHTRNVYYWDYGSCHDCGRSVDSGTCSCNTGYSGTYCSNACNPGHIVQMFALPYSSTAASGNCTACLPGTYAPVAGLQACATCPNGFEAPQFGSTACRAVPTRIPTRSPSVQPVNFPTANPSAPHVTLFPSSALAPPQV
jgi:hypothetical protein